MTDRARDFRLPGAAVASSRNRSGRASENADRPPTRRKVRRLKRMSNIERPQRKTTKTQRSHEGPQRCSLCVSLCDLRAFVVLGQSMVERKVLRIQQRPEQVPEDLVPRVAGRQRVFHFL